MSKQNNFKIINKDLEGLFKKLSVYTDEELNKNMNKNKWSIAENLYHLWLTEFITIKYIKKKTSYPESLVNVSYFSKFKMKLLELIFFTGIKMKAPKITYDSMPKNIEIKKLREK